MNEVVLSAEQFGQLWLLGYIGLMVLCGFKGYQSGLTR